MLITIAIELKEILAAKLLNTFSALSDLIHDADSLAPTELVEECPLLLNFPHPVPMSLMLALHTKCL